MARAALAIGLAFALAGCGLAARDTDVVVDLEAGGGAPTDGTASVSGASLVSPLAADVSALKSVTLSAARLEGDNLSFISGATITITGNGLSPATIATLQAGETQFQVSGTELKPYLLAGGTLGVQLAFTSRPVQKKTMKLTLTLRGELL